MEWVGIFAMIYVALGVLRADQKKVDGHDVDPREVIFWLPLWIWEAAHER